MEETARPAAPRPPWREQWAALARLEALLGMRVPLDGALAAALGPAAAIQGRAGRPLALGPPCIDTFALEDALIARHGKWTGSMAGLLRREYGAEALAIIARSLDGQKEH